MFSVQILEGHNQVHSRNGKPDSDGVVKKYFHQFAYVILADSPFPQKMKVPVECPAESYPVGDYQISPLSFRIGRFDSFEVDNFNLKLIKAK